MQGQHGASAGACRTHQKLCEAEARREVVQLVAEPTRPRLPSTARTMVLLRMSARKASYQALATTSSRSASAAPDQAHIKVSHKTPWVIPC
jgi:hypothetical protein